MAVLKYRNATFDDLPKIVAIYNSTIASRMVTADTEEVSVEDKLNWFHEHSTNFRPLWMIENLDNEVIGWVSFQSFYGRPAYNGTAEISIYLDQNFRGNGYGKQILEYSLQQASTFGIKDVLAFIFAHNEPSVNLFQNFGFEVWGNFPNIAVLDDIERSLLILGKRIV